jgi:hypothetical protein
MLQRNANSYCSESEIRLKINIDCAEQSNGLSVAESVAVPVKRIHNRSQVKGWSRNPELAAACASAKLWLKVWYDSGKPRSGIVNEIRIPTKRKFNKTLDAHRATLKEIFRRLGGITVTLSSHITYLGLPTGCNLREIQSLLI